MGWSFPAARVPRCSPGGVSLRGLWRGSWVDTCGFCTSVERVMGQQQIRVVLLVTPSGTCWTSCTFSPKCLCLLWAAWEHSGEFLHWVPTRSCCHHGFRLHACFPLALSTLHCSWVFPHRCSQTPLAARIRYCACAHFPMAPMCSGLCWWVTGSRPQGRSAGLHPDPALRHTNMWKEQKQWHWLAPPILDCLLFSLSEVDIYILSLIV